MRKVMLACFAIGFGAAMIFIMVVTEGVAEALIVFWLTSITLVTNWHGLRGAWGYKHERP